jgi:hypothetical protein
MPKIMDELKKEEDRSILERLEQSLVAQVGS